VCFEDIKHIRSDGSEYWMARELARALDYTEWRNFERVLDKAMIACVNSGRESTHDFVDINKIVDAGTASKPVNDYELSRYACYLVVQNGDPRKEAIANLFRISKQPKGLSVTPWILPLMLGE